MKPLLDKISRLFSKGNEPKRFFISLIILRKEYRAISLRQLEEFVRVAYGVVLNEGMPLHTVAEITPQSFLIKLGGEVIQVLNSKKPYSEDPEKDAAEFPTSEWREAWKEHRSWISVDYVSGEGVVGEDALGKYPFIGRLAAHFIDETCIGVYVPGATESDPPRFRVFDPDLHRDLFG